MSWAQGARRGGLLPTGCLWTRHLPRLRRESEVLTQLAACETAPAWRSYGVHACREARRTIYQLNVHYSQCTLQQRAPPWLRLGLPQGAVVCAASSHSF
jgi:hypothetical protein